MGCGLWREIRQLKTDLQDELGETINLTDICTQNGGERRGDPGLNLILRAIANL